MNAASLYLAFSEAVAAETVVNYIQSDHNNILKLAAQFLVMTQHHRLVTLTY